MSKNGFAVTGQASEIRTRLYRTYVRVKHVVRVMVRFGNMVEVKVVVRVR